MSVFFTIPKICKYRISELIIPIFPETCYNRKQRGNLPERRIEIMKIYQDILGAKLQELEQQYDISGIVCKSVKGKIPDRSTRN